MVNTNLKLISILAFTLIGIQLVSACSIAVPDYTHLAGIRNTSDPNLFIVNVVDDNYNIVEELVLNVETGSLEPLGDRIFLDRVISASDYKYTSKLRNENNETRITANSINNWELFDISLTLEESFVFDLSASYFFMVSEKLRLAYIGFPYNIDSASTIDADFSSLFIVPLDNPSNITFSYTVSSYYFWTASNWYTLYDEYGIIMMPGQGADCNSGTYMKFDENGFEIILTLWAGTNANFDPEFNRIILVENDWNTNQNQSVVKIHDYELGTVTEFSFSASEIEGIITPTSQTTNNTDGGETNPVTDSESLELPIASIFIAGSLAAMTLMRRRK